MKKIILMVQVMVAYAGFAFSQTSFSFVDDDMQWSYVKELNLNDWYGLTPYRETIIYQYFGDTTINDTEYHIMKKSEDRCSTWQYVGFLREDEKQKIYFIKNGENTESLVYCFSYTDEECKSSDISVDSILIGGQKVPVYTVNRKKVSLYGEYEKRETFVSEIGGLCQFAFDDMSCGCIDDMVGGQYYSSLLCVQKGDEIIYHNPNYDECYYHQEHVAIDKISKQDFLISPNPVNSTLYITLPQGEHTITIYNAAGIPVLKQQTAEPQAQIGVNGFPAGVYFVQVDGGEMLKFVKE